MIQNIIYKVNAILGNPSVPSGFIKSTEGAAKIAGMLDFLIIISTILATFYFIYSGLLYITSAGDPGKVKTAMASMQWATVGLIVCIIAFILVRVIGATLGITNFNLPF